MHPEWRRQGVGRALVEQAQLQLALTDIRAETDRSAAGFYERSGFRVSSLGENIELKRLEPTLAGAAQRRGA